MTQETFKINQSVLKHFRKKLNLTQEGMADVCYLSTRQYQRIESKGHTTGQKAQVLADKIGLTLGELKTSPNEDDSFWFVTNPFSQHATLEQGFYKVKQEVEKWAARYVSCNFEGVSLHINNKAGSLKEMSLIGIDENYTWTIRPVQLNDEVGLLWCELSEWQTFIWEEALRELKYDSLDSVYVDGNPIVPNDEKAKFVVMFDEVKDSKRLYEGYKLFESDSEFRVSLVDWLQNQKHPVSTYGHNTGQLLLIYFCCETSSSKRLIIQRAWKSKNEELQLSPWPKANKEILEKAINEHRRGKPIYLPVGIGENYIDETIPLMKPNIIINQIEELPEFDINVDFDK